MPVKPRVGVVIPMFNARETVEHTLRSLTAQTLSDWRAVVVDDGSTDGSAEIVGRVCATEDRIRMVHKANAGLSRARNTGIDAAEGEYLLFLDADDVLFPEALESLVGAAHATGLGAAYCGYEFLDGDGRLIGRQTAAAADPVGIDALLEWNRFIAHSQIIRRDVLGDDRFDASLTSGEDYDLWLRLGVRGVRWAAVHRFGAGYRIRPGSMSKNFATMAANESRIISASFDRLRKRGGPNGADTSDLRERTALTHSALAYSTRAAIAAHDDGISAGERIFAQWQRNHPVSATAVANATIFATQFGEARDPGIVLSEPARWVGRLEAWWRTLATRGWTEDGDAPAFAARTLEAMAMRIVHPRQVAGAALDVAGDVRHIVAVGTGARARWIGRIASERGVRAMLVETPGPRWDDVGAHTLCIAGVDQLSPECARSPVIVTGEPMSEDARAWAARVPIAITWEYLAARLAADIAIRLRAARDQSLQDAG